MALSLPMAILDRREITHTAIPTIESSVASEAMLLQAAPRQE
jgi:hypothetical protein